MHPADWRKKKGLTLREAAEVLGCSSASCVLRYEIGERETPTSVSLAYLAASAGLVTAEEIDRVRKDWIRRDARKKSQARRGAGRKPAARKSL